MMAVMNSEGRDDATRWHPAWADHYGRDRATALYARAFGAAPESVKSAPGRVNLIGEHTDYNRGVCLPTIIRHRTFVAGGRRADDELHIVSAQGKEFTGPGERWEGRLEDISAESAAGWPGYVAGVLWSMQERGFFGAGLNLAIDSCVPLGVGLSSSAALSSGTALVVNDLWRLALESPGTRRELAEACIDAENVIVGTPTGGMDQYCVLHCSDDSAVAIDFAHDPPSVHSAPLYFPDYGLALLIVDTRTRHNLADGRYKQRFNECQSAARALGVASLRDIADEPFSLSLLEDLTDETLKKRARHVVTEIDRVHQAVDELSGTSPAHERFTELGRILYASHASLARDFDVSCPELDLAVEASLGAGALGARLVGGGFGGAIVALVRKSHTDLTVAAIEQAFADAGYLAPRFVAV